MSGSMSFRWLKVAWEFCNQNVQFENNRIVFLLRVCKKKWKCKWPDECVCALAFVASRPFLFRSSIIMCQMSFSHCFQCERIHNMVDCFDWLADWKSFKTNGYFPSLSLFLSVIDHKLMAFVIFDRWWCIQSDNIGVFLIDDRMNYGVINLNFDNINHWFWPGLKLTRRPLLLRFQYICPYLTFVISHSDVGVFFVWFCSYNYTSFTKSEKFHIIFFSFCEKRKKNCENEIVWNLF